MKTIRLAIRSILHFRMYSGINLLGLALSLACVIIIFRYVYGEFTVDRFNKNFDRIYVTTEEYNSRPGDVSLASTFPSLIVPEKAFIDLTAHPGVENYTSFRKFDNSEIYVNDQKHNASILFTDSAFLKIFDYAVISGASNLAEPRSALITENYAQKLFGAQNPVGKTFRYYDEILTITGVIGQTSTKSSITYDVMISYNFYKYPPSGNAFVLLYQGVDYRTINKQFEYFSESSASSNEQIRYQLFPLSKIYFDKSIGKTTYYNNTTYNIFRQGNYDYLTLLMVVGALILLVGVISYINIYTVIILRRGRELGVKKVFGARGHNIFIQLLVENLLMTGLALMLAFLFVKMSKSFIINELHFDMISNICFDFFLSFILLICISLIATLYPFFRYQYSTVVNSIQDFDKIQSTGNLRHVFLSFQYLTTIAMIIVSLFFIKQLQFMLNADPGYRTKDIIKVMFKMPSTGGGASAITGIRDTRTPEELQMLKDKNVRIADEIAQKINTCPLITYWTRGYSPNEFGKGGQRFRFAEGEYREIRLAPANDTWLKLFDIQLKEGQLWDDTMIDVGNGTFIVVTESVLKQYGITDFNKAVLQSENENLPPFRIVGVVKDFDFLHLSQKSNLVAMTNYFNDNNDKIIASIVPGRTQEAIAFLRNLHDEMVGGEFSYSFVEDEIREMYKEDKKIATIYSIFTFIAIFISVLGLLSMSLFDIQQRRKEIAIRKVNGAMATDIIRLLLKKYFWSLLISFVIASPVAMLAINRYLEDFAHKATVSWWLFAAAIVITAGISLLTLIYQTQKAANRNPAEVVKTE